MVRNMEPVKMLAMESDSESDEDSSSETEGLQMPVASSQHEQLPSSSDDDDDDGGGEEEKVSVEPLSSLEITPTPAKRHANEDTLPASKKSKVSDNKPNAFQRFWREEDEIVILDTIIEYCSENKKKYDPATDFKSVHDLIKKKLQKVFTRIQLQDKIHRLRKKFQNKCDKVKDDGAEQIFSNSHDKAVYDLSRKVWGVESVERKKKESNCNAARMTVNEDAERKSTMWTATNQNMLEERMLVAGRALEGTKEWNELKQEEMKLYLQHLEIRVAQTNLVLKTMKAGDQ